MGEEKKQLVRVFTEINWSEGTIVYHKESWDGPKVTPRRPYPSRLIKLIRNKDNLEGREYILDPFELIWKAPKDEKINAYIIGDSSYFSERSFSSISQPPRGPKYAGRIETSQSYGREETDKHLLSVTYCSLSQRDLDKK